MRSHDTTEAAASLRSAQPASWIEKTPGVCGGDACVRKTGITVWGLVDFDTTRPTYATRPDKCHISAVNDHGGFGRWAFLGISDPWDAENTIRAAVNGHHGRAVSPGAAGVL
jgi:hypothetical protein